MKIISFVLSLILSLGLSAQSKKEEQVISRTYLLSRTVFGTKDSLTLENLFAKTASYGHSGGKLQNRREAIDGIAHNKSFYTDTAITIISVTFDDDVAIVRHLFKTVEHTVDGKELPLNFSIMLVWLKEKGNWRLMGRQAVKLL